MTFLQDALAVILVVGGTFFMLVGSIGINRLPDFFTRAHAAGKVDTLGILMFMLGLAVFEGFTLTSLKLVLIILFVAFTSPVAAHALARRALLYGMKPLYGKQKDQG